MAWSLRLYFRKMIEHRGTLISEELFEKRFVCDLSACKGACCEVGDSGAPLEPEEARLIAQHYDADNWETKRAANKAALQRKLGLS